ncbi:MAG: RdgB/HAM1 family non-canonical purine NTP pyrophosphatase [Actinomycetota bacterium]|nr:RdgB/HAM1 family non-canonical purine NTP pyrophosphatase [Actinomycetota bacterium]
MRLVMGSANPDKVSELASLLDGFEVALRPAGMGDVVEDADTLEGNARLKARAVCAAAGEASVADDTGLEVDALGGAPGVHSARYAGDDASYDDNVDKLLAELDGVPAERRTARFRTVAIVAWPDGREVVVDGVCEGSIGFERQGTNGFGYDPVFIPDEAPSETFATMESSAKHRISHRGRALRALRAALG